MSAGDVEIELADIGLAGRAAVFFKLPVQIRKAVASARVLTF